MSDSKKVFITKYALTAGIIEREVSKVNGEYIWVHEKGALNGETMYRASQCFQSFEDAASEAHRMRLNRIDSLKQQIKKLQGMDFWAARSEAEKGE